MEKYSISYSFTQPYTSSNIFDLFTRPNDTKKYMEEVELIDKIVENMENLDIALQLIETCKQR